MNFIYLIIICIFVFLLFRYSNFENYNEKKDKIKNKYDEYCQNFSIITNKKYKKIIFTITTFFDFNIDNWLLFCNSIDNILHFHSGICAFLDFYVINEFSDNHKQDWKKIINQKYPFIHFIQKTEEFKGQSDSLNLILSIIKSYTYWIYWNISSDEVWEISREFLFDQ